MRTQTFTHSSATLANRLRTPDREMEAGERRKEGGREGLESVGGHRKRWRTKREIAKKRNREGEDE